MSGREDMITAAERSLGIGEPNYIQDWYHARNGPAFSGNFAWCDASITYWAAHSGNYPAVCYNKDYAWTVAHALRFKDAAAWHKDVIGITRGDIVFFDWAFTDSMGAIDHVGLVTSVSGADVHTIEGNSANVCARRVRHRDTIAGYGRPAYVNPTPKPPPPRIPQYVPFPGAGFFTVGNNSPIITAMGRRLVAEGCSHYLVGPGPQWGEADRLSYSAWQRKLGYTGDAANGIPGPTSWSQLKVPK